MNSNENRAMNYRYAQVGVPKDVTFSATITLNLSQANNFNISPITSNFTLANPTEITVGQCGYIRVEQDGTGGYQPTFGSYFKFVGGVPAEPIDPAASAVSTLEYRVASATEIHVGINKGWSNA